MTQIVSSWKANWLHKVVEVNRIIISASKSIEKFIMGFSISFSELQFTKVQIICRLDQMGPMVKFKESRFV